MANTPNDQGDLRNTLQNLLDRYTPSEILYTLHNMLSHHVKTSSVGEDTKQNLDHHVGKLGYIANKFDYLFED